MTDAVAGLSARDELRHFLRSRRARLRPEDVGLPPRARRRVPGLRREEIAQLAGVSADYYGRLERGTDVRPSPEVLEALSGALRLSPAERMYLLRLAGAARGAHACSPPTGVRPALRRLVERLDTPAIVVGGLLDVLEANAGAVALLPGAITGSSAAGSLVRHCFIDPDARSLYVDWDAVARGAVAHLRTTAVTDLADPAAARVVAELAQRSAAFREMWARHDVRERMSGRLRLQHPRAGRLDLHAEMLAVADPGQWLVLYGAEGPASEARLAALRRA